jgi:general secretion pathway protein G
MNARASRADALTLVEVLIVVIVLGVLAAVVVPRFSAAASDTRQGKLAASLMTVRAQLQLYRREHHGACPSWKSFMTAMTGRTHADGGTRGSPALGPYLPRIPANPFNDLSTVGDANAALGSTGWIYDETSGAFRANDCAANQAL